MAPGTVSQIKIVNNQIISKNNEDENKNKRNLSTSSSSSQSSSHLVSIKKSKLFVTPNRYSTLFVDESTVNNIENTSDNLNKKQPNITNYTPKTTLPPSIFIKEVLDHIDQLNHFK